MSAGGPRCSQQEARILRARHDRDCGRERLEGRQQHDLQIGKGYAIMMCLWCKGEFEDVVGSEHEFFGSSRGCWEAYSRALAVEYEHYDVLGDVHRLTVDTYAAQHPGRPSRKSIQSVWGHLMAMHLYLEREQCGDRVRAALGRFVDAGLPLEWLPPPEFTGTLTVNHVLESSTSEDHIRRVNEWGRSVLACWRGEHSEQIDAMILRLR
jgi:hypothetical protein